MFCSEPLKFYGRLFTNFYDRETGKALKEEVDTALLAPFVQVIKHYKTIT